MPDTPVQLLSAALGKLKHWAGSAHVASPVAGVWEIGADGVEGGPVPFVNLYFVTARAKRKPEEKADCTDYIL